MLFTVTPTNGFVPPPPCKSGLKLVCNVNIVYGNPQDYAQKPQQNCTFMNSASGYKRFTVYVHRTVVTGGQSHRVHIFLEMKQG